MRKAIRFAGKLFLYAACGAAAFDVVQWLTAPEMDNLAFGALWAAIHRDSLLLLQPAIERHVEPHVGQWLWDPVMLKILTAPAWLVFAVIGALLLLAPAPRAKPAAKP